MPLNEILAASYCIIRYTTDVPYQHSVRLYFDAVPTFDAVGNKWVFGTYTDATHVSGWSLQQIVKTVFDRFVLTTTMPALTIDGVEVWQSALGVNTFLGLDPDDYSGVLGGAANSDPSAYTMFVTKAADRSQFRFTIFDTGRASPQRTPVPPIPVADDGSFAWFMARSAVKFVTNDNKRITAVATVNTGYNRKLARSYGRRILT